MINAQARRARGIITSGLRNIDLSNAAVGQEVVVVLNDSWKEAGKTFTAEVLAVEPKNDYIRIKFTSDRLPYGAPDSGVIRISTASVHHSKLFLLSEPVTHGDTVSKPDEPTLFSVLSEYDLAVSALQFAKADEAKARERFIAARAALGQVLAKHKDL